VNTTQVTAQADWGCDWGLYYPIQTTPGAAADSSTEVRPSNTGHWPCRWTTWWSDLPVLTCRHRTSETSCIWRVRVARLPSTQHAYHKSSAVAGECTSCQWRKLSFWRQCRSL